jgi:pyruvate/2-oxoglutarate dehydrogenase complex dihydrolipoamide acyltransferase (E2) component
MPQLGETVAEGKIVKWFKAAGDSVKPGDNLFEIETDKTSMEVPSITAGTLSEIRFQVGEVAKVGAVVAVISGAGAAASPAAARSTNVPPKAPVAPVPAVTPAVHSTPMPRPAAPMDPFREVRTPERNYGPAKLASGTAVTPLAGGWLASAASIFAHLRFRPAWPHRRARRGAGGACACWRGPGRNGKRCQRSAGESPL